jgi:gamma-tubulin complex component 4
LHPGEAQILENIIKIIDQYRGILKFIYSHNTQIVFNNTHQSVQDFEPLQKGLYVQAFSDGIGTVLQEYRDMIVNLEKRYLKNPDFSLIFVYKQIEAFQPLFCLLIRLISGIKTQR